MIAIDAETRSVLDWLRKHSASGKPALFTIAASDARRIVALVEAFLEEPVLQIHTDGIDLDELKRLLGPTYTKTPNTIVMEPATPPPPLDLAHGVYLNTYGRVYGLPRYLGEDDAVYRERLRELITKGPGYAAREAQQGAADNGYHPRQTHGRLRAPRPLADRPAHKGYPVQKTTTSRCTNWPYADWDNSRYVKG